MDHTHNPSFELLETITTASLHEISRLLDAGANPNTRDVLDGSTCLHQLASTGRLDAIQLLLSRGADPNILTQNTTTSPLAVAALAGKETTVDLLIENGALLSQSELTSNLIEECQTLGYHKIANFLKSLTPLNPKP
jgi:ankyrin repeat protein